MPKYTVTIDTDHNTIRKQLDNLPEDACDAFLIAAADVYEASGKHRNGTPVYTATDLRVAAVHNLVQLASGVGPGNVAVAHCTQLDATRTLLDRDLDDTATAL